MRYGTRIASDIEGSAHGSASAKQDGLMRLFPMISRIERSLSKVFLERRASIETMPRCPNISPLRMVNRSIDQTLYNHRQICYTVSREQCLENNEGSSLDLPRFRGRTESSEERCGLGKNTLSFDLFLS